MKNRAIHISGLFLAILIITSIFFGRYSLRNFKDALANPFYQKLIWNLRLPRIFTAVVSGIALSLSGYILQIIFRNPLADPGVIGVSQAAGFGAAFAILFFNSGSIYIQIFAFAFSLLALLITSLITSKIRSKSIISMVLSGIAVSALFSAALGLLKYLADPIDELPSIVFWLLGSMANSRWEYLNILFIINLPIFIILWLYRWRLNVHNLDDEISFTLGLNSNFEKYLLVACAVLMTSSVISFSGVIGWVGLIIPNIARIVAGGNSSKSLLVAGFYGATFLLICDDLSRTLLPGEIPIGILTAFFGAAIFIFILVKRKFR